MDDLYNFFKYILNSCFIENNKVFIILFVFLLIFFFIWIINKNIIKTFLFDLYKNKFIISIILLFVLFVQVLDLYFNNSLDLLYIKNMYVLNINLLELKIIYQCIIEIIFKYYSKGLIFFFIILFMSTVVWIINKNHAKQFFIHLHEKIGSISRWFLFIMCFRLFIFYLSNSLNLFNVIDALFYTISFLYIYNYMTVYIYPLLFNKVREFLTSIGLMGINEVSKLESFLGKMSIKTAHFIKNYNLYKSFVIIFDISTYIMNLHFRFITYPLYKDKVILGHLLYAIFAIIYTNYCLIYGLSDYSIFFKIIIIYVSFFIISGFLFKFGYFFLYYYLVPIANNLNKSEINDIVKDKKSQHIVFTESFDLGKTLGKAGIDIVKKYPRTALAIGTGIAVGYGIHCGLTHMENMSKIASNEKFGLAEIASKEKLGLAEIASKEKVGLAEIEAKYKNKKGGGWFS